MLLLYNLFIQAYHLAIRLASLRNAKAAAWIKGREGVFQQLQKSIAPSDRVIWMHCSSAGEFEQGKPVLEALKKQYPFKKIVVSFFSPSGYQQAKNYEHADVITYLPLDTPKKAKQFHALVHPELIIFVKYEFWYHHLSVAAFYGVPTVLISAVFRKRQLFFKRAGRFFKQILFLFRHIFVQDTTSLCLLKDAGIAHCSLSGDTRYDRVAAIANQPADIPLINNFIANNPVLVAGSTWEGDEEMLASFAQTHPEMKIIIAPHEINTAHLQSLQQRFVSSCLYSSLQPNPFAGSTAENKSTHQGLNVQVLIIDCVGLLSRLYRYATVTYVGGGFTRDGIHNILEAAVWGKPVFFGPNYQKYREAAEIIQAGGGFSIFTAEDLKEKADDLLKNPDHLLQTCLKAKIYIAENTGATNAILQTLYEKRLLIN